MKRVYWVPPVVSLLVGRSAVGFTEDATMVAGMHTDESVKALALNGSHRCNPVKSTARNWMRRTVPS